MVTGFLGANTEGYHAWNKVNIDNTWYNIDTTQEDKKDEENYRYFLISDERLGCEEATQENSR